jgi:hypothetical protein
MRRSPGGTRGKEGKMSGVIIPIVAIVSTMVVLPLVIVGAILAGRYMKIKERELIVREKELEVQRGRYEALKLMEANEALDKTRT